MYRHEIKLIVKQILCIKLANTEINILRFTVSKTSKILKFVFGIELYMFRTGLLSIIRSLVPHDIYLLLCIQY